MLVSSGVFALLIVAAGLLAVACLQAKEVFGSQHDWQLELRRMKRNIRNRIPYSERLSFVNRLLNPILNLSRKRTSWRNAIDEMTEVQDDYEWNVRQEITRIVGKQVYHGQKEQL